MREKAFDDEHDDDGGERVGEVVVARVERRPRHPQHVEREHAPARRRRHVDARRPDDVAGRERRERHGVVLEHVVEERHAGPRVEARERAALLV